MPVWGHGHCSAADVLSLTLHEIRTGVSAALEVRIVGEATETDVDAWHTWWRQKISIHKIRNHIRLNEVEPFVFFCFVCLELNACA